MQKLVEVAHHPRVGWGCPLGGNPAQERKRGIFCNFYVNFQVDLNQVFEREECEVRNCRISSDRKELDTADMVIFRVGIH